MLRFVMIGCLAIWRNHQCNTATMPPLWRLPSDSFSWHINFRKEKVTSIRDRTQKIDNCIQSGASGLGLGWVDLDLGSSPGWWAASVATYCPNRMVEHPKSNSTQPSPKPDAPDCTAWADTGSEKNPMQMRGNNNKMTKLVLFPLLDFECSTVCPSLPELIRI